MKQLRTLMLVLALVMLAAAVAGCAGTPAAQESGLALTDMAGREIQLAGPAQKIVALTANDCEILCAIGAQDLLVGRGEYCDYPETVLNVPSVQSGYETNIEQIIALEPDVVVMAKMAQTVEQIESLEQAGIAVVETDAQTIADVYAEIELLGKLTGKETEAAAVIDSMKTGFSEISAAESEGKTVYFEVSPLEYGLWAAGSGTFMDEIATMLGLENAFSDVSGWAEISEEQVIDRDPDYIVTIAMYYGEGPTPVEEIMQRPGWQELTAVKNGDVYNGDSDELSVPGPRLVDGARALAQFVNGD